MYLLPDKLEINELIGQQINMVCVGPYDAQVHFDNGMVLQSFYRLEGEIAGVKTLWFNGERVNTSDVLKFPKQEVVGVKRISDKEFRIELTNSVTLCFHTEESMYESINPNVAKAGGLQSQGV